MAKSLRDSLAARNVSLSHSECIEIVAQQFGFANWNTLAAKLITQPLRRTSCLVSFCGKSHHDVRASLKEAVRACALAGEELHFTAMNA